MNVTDVKVAPEDLAVTCRLEAIFAKQRQLMEKYHHIEKASGLLQTEDVPVNLHDARGQARLKDFCWRTTEELGEATAAYEDHPELTIHVQEELADALHFMVELLILAGIGPEDIVPITKEGQDRLQWFYEKPQLQLHLDDPSIRLHLRAYQVVHRLSRAMNCCKQRPWKVTHMLTDVPRLRSYLLSAFEAFMPLLAEVGLDASGIYDIYIRKQKTNMWRQKSKY